MTLRELMAKAIDYASDRDLNREVKVCIVRRDSHGVVVARTYIPIERFHNGYLDTYGPAIDVSADEITGRGTTR